MNYRIIFYIIGWILNIEAAFMLLPFLTGVIYQESALWSFVIRRHGSAGISAIAIEVSWWFPYESDEGRKPWSFCQQTAA